MTLDHWDIIAYLGVGPLRFGMPRPQDRSLIGLDISVFKKGPTPSRPEAMTKRRCRPCQNQNLFISLQPSAILKRC